MSYKEDTKFDSTTDWMINGDTGLSSESLLAAGTGVERKGSFKGLHTPSDPSDLNRCIIFADNFPEIAEKAFEVYREKGGKLAKFANNYPALKIAFENEVGYNWSKSRRAELTYQIMKGLGF